MGLKEYFKEMGSFENATLGNGYHLNIRTPLPRQAKIFVRCSCFSLMTSTYICFYLIFIKEGLVMDNKGTIMVSISDISLLTRTLWNFYYFGHVYKFYFGKTSKFCDNLRPD